MIIDNKILLPQPLNIGDKAIIISPSGCINEVYLDKALTILNEWGLNTFSGQYANQHCGRFGGSIEERLSDLQSAMDDEYIKLIFCSRGGYGVVHLLDKLDFRKIEKNPKWLVGYSDITALHLAFLQNGLASLHAPMAKHLVDEENDPASQYLQKILFSGYMSYKIESHELNINGSISGLLFGGNLAVLSGLIGTQYMNIPQNGILFLEDIAEAPYKIDRMMWQLELSGILGKLSGLIIGQFSDCEEDPLMEASVYESIKKIVSKYNYPIAFNFPVGHVKENYPLIHGARVNFEVTQDNVRLELKK